MLIFRQLFDQQSSTYTYVLGDPESGEAVIIDPVFEQARRDHALIEELDLTLVFTLETHCHADHVTGAWLLKQRSRAEIGISRRSGVEGADRYLEHGDQVRFGNRFLGVRETPGHTSGCVTYVLDDESMAFTGDTLLIRGCGRTDFQEGDPRQMYRSIHMQIFVLPDGTLLYPGHDYHGRSVTTVLEERQHSPRLGGEISEDDFVGYMNSLGLPHPQQIDIAVPANMKCGRPETGEAPSETVSWAPLTYTFAGVWEIHPQWLEENSSDVQIIDVREPAEFEGPLGHIRDARLIPLAALADRVSEISSDKPVVTVCRAGARSAQATVILSRAGFTDVANLAGGMLRWRARGYPVQGGVD
jgi:glyoxylase-like metal-dependent hydrolase (beta-lactamase superfamily II)/rhodanese-related sulfurtransferase